MIPKAAEVRLTPEDRLVLEARVRAPTSEQRDVLRARIVLLADEGRSTRSIAGALGVMPRTVSLWRGRYSREGLAGLSDRPRPGPKPRYDAAAGRRILALLDEPAPAGYARWTGSLLAAALGDVHEQQVWRFLREQKIDLAGRKSWCESKDPEFVAKAAFEVATGKVMAAHKKRRRRVEFLDFMNEVVTAWPDQELHVILDNLNTHKPRNDRWLKRHPNVHFHFTPTRASWLNQVEIWFSILQGKSLSGASFNSVGQLRKHIDAFIEAYNQKARPFVWTKAKVRQRPSKTSVSVNCDSGY